jgi:glutamine synthetase
MELGIESLPVNLFQAIDKVEQSEVVRRALGDHIFNNFITNKKIEWDDYRARVHPYELDKYLSIL